MKLSNIKKIVSERTGHNLNIPCNVNGNRVWVNENPEIKNKATISWITKGPEPRTNIATIIETKVKKDNINISVTTE